MAKTWSYTIANDTEAQRWEDNVAVLAGWTATIPNPDIAGQTIPNPVTKVAAVTTFVQTMLRDLEVSEERRLRAQLARNAVSRVTATVTKV